MKKLHSLSVVLIMVLLCLCTFSCSKAQKKDGSVSDTSRSSVNKSEKISIVTTNFPCYDFAREILVPVNDDLTAGNIDFENIELKLLIKPGMELHSFDPTPNDIIAVQNADLFIYVGGESDEWVEKILSSSKKKPANILRLIDFTDNVEEESVEGMEEESEELDGHHHEVTHEKHHFSEAEEPELDEHVWTSSVNAEKMIAAIKDALCKIDLENSDYYTQNAELYCKKIEGISSDIASVVNNSQTKLIIVGDRFPLRYFAEQYGLSYRAAFAGCSSAVEAKTSTVSYLIDFAKENQVPAIFAIELSNQKLAKTIAESCGADVLELHSCHNVTKTDFDAGVTYAVTMQRNLESLKAGLR